MVLKGPKMAKKGIRKVQKYHKNDKKRSKICPMKPPKNA